MTRSLLQRHALIQFGKAKTQATPKSADEAKARLEALFGKNSEPSENLC